MPTFNYTVNTQPLADKMGGISGHVNATTAAVIAMQTAIIEAEEEAAKHVSENVNKGFYSLIRSQISQKIAKLQSSVDSQLMLMDQQKNALKSIKLTMQKDYNMISARYNKIFNVLNSNLKNRVYELDSPVITFAFKEINRLTNRVKYLAGSIPINQSESLALSQKILASNLKDKGYLVIKSMKYFLSELDNQRKVTQGFISSIVVDSYNYERLIPVVIYECNKDKIGGMVLDITISSRELGQESVELIKNTVFNQFDNIQWVQNTSINSKVKSEYLNLLSKSIKSQRIITLTEKLLSNNIYKDIK